MGERKNVDQREQLNLRLNSLKNSALQRSAKIFFNLMLSVGMQNGSNVLRSATHHHINDEDISSYSGATMVAEEVSEILNYRRY